MNNLQDTSLGSAPTILSKPIFNAFVRVFVLPFEKIRIKAMSFRDEMIKRARINGQTCQLEWFLNSTFDCQGIEITDGGLGGLYLHHRGDAFTDVLIGHKDEPTVIVRHIDDTDTDNFVVKVPSQWVNGSGAVRTLSTFDKARIKAIVNKYKLVQMKYSIEVYEEI